MYLATLAPQNWALSTYFAATADGVGGGGPPTKPTTCKHKKNPRSKREPKRLPSSSTVSVLRGWLAIGYDAHSTDE